MGWSDHEIHSPAGLCDALHLDGRAQRQAVGAECAAGGLVDGELLLAHAHLVVRALGEEYNSYVAELLANDDLMWQLTDYVGFHILPLPLHRAVEETANVTDLTSYHEHLETELQKLSNDKWSGFFRTKEKKSTYF